jgi:SAM-dependent methyltransferase
MSTSPNARAADRLASEHDSLGDLGQGYPANHFAWRIVLDRARTTGAESLVEVGVGRGNGVAHVLNAGLTFAGLDRDPEAVELTRYELTELGADPARVIRASVEDPAVSDLLPDAGGADVLMALGIMPHAADQRLAVESMARLVRPGGEMFIEFRNSLFSLVTFNRLTRDFILDDLFGDVPASTRQRVADFIEPRLEMAKPPEGSSALTSHYANPLAIPEWFTSIGFPEVTVHPFHFHAAMPLLEGADPREFRDGSLALEDDTSGWRGLFLCSVFLARVVRPRD